MSKITKLKERLLLCPNDFKWSELKTLLISFGYRESNVGKTSGSRVKFVSDEHPPIILHKPHPKPVLKRYQLKQLIEHLKKEKLI